MRNSVDFPIHHKISGKLLLTAGADLSQANLSQADLSYADLSYANLSYADLSGADLSHANLSHANLRDAKIDDNSAAMFSIVPETGAFEGWKKCRNGVIVKMRIPAKAKRSNAVGRKCRAEFVKVLKVFGAYQGESIHDSSVKYHAGDTTRCDEWNPDRWVECGGGIHFFITRSEAEAYTG